MRMEEFKQFVTAKMKAYPNIKEEILDFYYLAKDEIEDGGSEIHEINLAINSINEFIGEVNEQEN